MVEEAVWKCENDSFDAVCVHNTSDPTISFWSKVRKFERDMYRGDELNVAARFFRKKIFKELGGFDEALVAAEDYDLHNRLLKRGFKIGKINAEEVHIGEPGSLWEIAQKHYYYMTFGYSDFAANLNLTTHSHGKCYRASIEIMNIHSIQYFKISLGFFLLNTQISKIFSTRISYI